MTLATRVHRHATVSIAKACPDCRGKEPEPEAGSQAAQLRQLHAELSQLRTETAIHRSAAEARAATLTPDMQAVLAGCPDCHGAGKITVVYRNGSSSIRRCQRCVWARSAAGVA